MNTPNDTRETGCALCNELSDAATPVAYADDHVVVFPARWPAVGHEGAVLVVTRQHTPTIYDINDALAGPLMRRLRDIAAAVHQAFAATGTTIRQNNGPPGQDVAHLHFHIAPRYANDDFWNAEVREATRAERTQWAARIGAFLTRSPP